MAGFKSGRKYAAIVEAFEENNLVVGRLLELQRFSLEGSCCPNLLRLAAGLALEDDSRLLVQIL